MAGSTGDSVAVALSRSEVSVTVQVNLDSLNKFGIQVAQFKPVALDRSYYGKG